MEYLITKSQSEVLERTVRDQRGRFFRVRFVVVERDGIWRGKVVSCQQVFELRIVKDKGLRIKDFRYCLPVWLHHGSVKDKGLGIKVSFSSPYFNKFDFLTVIKIRAPSGVNS
jgi:hypothetical protein